jgi:hypothetical protein
MSIDLKELKPHHRGMARAQVAFGMKVKELADRFGLSAQQVTNITRSPLYKAEVARIEVEADNHVAELDLELKELAIRAVEIIAEDLMQVDPSGHRTSVAFNVLDRTGYAKKTTPQDNRKQQIVIHNYAPQPGDDPEEAIRELRELRKVFKEDEEDGEDDL